MHHYHYTSYFTFDAITEEQKQRVQEMNAQYGGDVIEIGDIVSGGKFFGISATSVALIVLLRKEVEKLNLSGFRHESLFDRKDVCDDEACVISKTGDAK